MDFSKRVTNPLGRWVSITEASIHLVTYVIMALATAAFLWEPGESKLFLYSPQEYQPYLSMCDEAFTISNGTATFPSDCASRVNIYERFTRIL